MASVSELVKKKEDSIKQSIEDHEERERKRKKKQISKDFSEEVRDVIRRFENRIFDINASKTKVADFIVDWTPRGAERPFGSRSLSYSEDYFYAIKFKKDETTGHTPITRSSKFNRWKKALEDKFGIVIWIWRDYEFKSRYSNSGYATHPDEIYQGLRANVYLKET